MGLSGRKIKQRIPTDPRNLSWANDANKFGTSYLQKFGWDSSVGLGPSGEGRTKHISVYQKLDMLGIGADHRNNEDGTAWKQGRDYENLLRRLNESTGKEVDEEAVMKVDGFVRPASAMESDELQTDGQKESHEETEEKRKSKKRKHHKGDRVEADDDDRKDKKKRKAGDDGAARDEKKHKKEKKRKHRNNATEGDSPVSNKPLSDSDPDPTVEARSSAIPAIVPRPLRAHRARHIASKGLASKSSVAISEILGIASSSVITTTSSFATSSVSTPATLTDPSAPDTMDSSSELKLQDLTTSAKSVMDYFREKLAAKSNRTAAVSDITHTFVTTLTPENDDYDDRPRGGLGASKIQTTETEAHGYEDRPRFGLGSASRVVEPGSPTSGAPEHDTAVHPTKEADDNLSESAGVQRKKSKKSKKSRRRGDSDDVANAGESAGAVISEDAPASTDTDAQATTKRKKRDKTKSREKDNQTDVVSDVRSTEAAPPDALTTSKEESKKSKKRDKRKREGIS